MIGGNMELTGNVLLFGSSPNITTGSFYGLYFSYGGGGTNVKMNLSNNTCTNQTIPGNGLKYLFYGSHTYAAPNSVMVATNNMITGNTFTGYGTLYGLYAGRALTDSIYNNS